MGWHWYFIGDHLPRIASALLSGTLILLISQAVLLFWVLVCRKQRWYHYLSLVLAGIITVWLSENLVQAQIQIQDLWNQLNYRGPAIVYRAVFERIDQAFSLFIMQVTVLLALAAVLFLLWRQVYSRVRRFDNRLDARA